ncbi:hypothetical protein [Streptomyces sp.]|uniref:hypothetical protein n=1 Tax=Streptomyces sp. TaxID=1931 RepID=UPI00281154E2|nr:hypothetical protein [Streptomyces sp.]
MKDPAIRPAVALTRIPLAKAGLPRRPLLGPTRGARRPVRDLPRTRPPPASRHDLSHDDRLPAAALRGEPDLRPLVPRFACGRAGPAVPRWAARPC